MEDGETDDELEIEEPEEEVESEEVKSDKELQSPATVNKTKIKELLEKSLQFRKTKSYKAPWDMVNQYPFLRMPEMVIIIRVYRT